MARFDGGVLGFLKGRIGTIVARMRYGEVYISPKALKYKIKSEKLKFAQKVFGRRASFNKQLRLNKKIQAFWKSVDAPGKNDNMKLMIRNQPFVAYDGIVPGCGFTPQSDNKIIVKDFHFDGNYGVFDFKIERADNRKLEPPYEVFSILMLDRELEDTKYGIIRHKSLQGDTVSMTFENEPQDSFQTFRSLHIGAVHNRMHTAEKAYILIAAIKFNELKNKYEWTDTYFQELQNYIPEDKQIKPGTPIYKSYD